MSLTQRLKQGFLRLPLMKKVILVSSFTLCISTVMPWYDQRNNFGVGDTYLGVQGPLFMVGLLVLLCGALSFFNMFLPLFGRHFFDLSRKTGALTLLTGAQALLLLMLANSVFFHPSFTAAVNNKSTRMGMAFAFFSIGAMLISGWWTRRQDRRPVQEEAAETFSSLSETLDEVIPVEPVPVQERPQEAVDPLTLDARTRYRMMKSQARFSSSARNNLWGSGSGSAYSRPREEERDY